jgi:hypothetical protein
MVWEFTLLKVAQVAGLVAFVTLIIAALRLGLRHRRDREQAAEFDNRYRNLFTPGVPDRAGDRTAELIGDLQETQSPQPAMRSQGRTDSPSTV